LYFVRKEVLFLVLFIPLLLLFAFLLNGAEFTYEADGESGVMRLDSPTSLLPFSALFGGVAALTLEAIAYAVGAVQSPSRRLYPDIQPVSREELVSRLMALNDPNKPWEIVEEDGNLVARWKVVDARWWEILKRAGLRIYYLGRMRLDDDRRMVLYAEEMGELEWAAGLSDEPVKFRYSKFRGRILFSKRKAVAYAFKSLLPLTGVRFTSSTSM